MAPASASLLPAACSNAGSKRPFAAEASDDAELPLALPQESAAGKKNGNGKSQQQKLECPRCSSSDTKFCYYNNYSTTQPRHYCRTCRRYWTQGGTLRSVPVGGACRRGGSSKRRKPSAEPQTPSSDSPQPDQDARHPGQDLPLPVFPFLTDGTAFLQQFDLGLGGFPWTTPVATDHLYDGLAAPWGGCDGALAPNGAWDDFGGIELTWPPPSPAGN